MFYQKTAFVWVVSVLAKASFAPTSASCASEAAFSDDFTECEVVNLLQRHVRSLPSRHLAQGTSSVFIPLMNQTFVGRYDVAESQGVPVVRFDAIGFEIQFNVQGATEVQVLLEQALSGPYGWWERPDHRSEYISQQRPHPNHVRHPKDGLPDVNPADLMQPPGSEPNHFLVYVDGVPQRTPLQPVSACRVCTFDTGDAVDGKATPYPVATGLDPSKSYSIRIVKTSEPEWCSIKMTPNWLAFHGLVLDSGTVVRPTKPPPKHKIEFIGDSWMAGFANVCNGTLETGPPWKGSNMGGESTDILRYGSFALAWPFVACEALEAECHSTILSGMGVYCNTHGDIDIDCASEDRLPEFWRRTLATVNESRWSMDQWVPAVVVISASQNDHLYSSFRSKADAIKSYEGFIHDIALSYPQAQIIITCGPFSRPHSEGVGDPECETVEKAVDAPARRGVKVRFLNMMHFATETDLGQCAGHMNEEYAKVVGEYFAENLKDSN